MKKLRRSAFPYASLYFISFASISALRIYQNLYLKRAGLSDSQLGTAAAGAALMAVVSPLIWGIAADSAADVRRLASPLFLGAAVTFPAMLLTRSYPVLAALAVLTSFFYTPLIPLLDALALGYVSRSGGDYGRVRLWGSLGFIFSTLLFKAILREGKTSGIGYGLLPVFIYFAALRVLGAGWSFLIPAPEGAERARPRIPELRGLLNFNLIAVLAAAFIGCVAMQSYYVFFSIYLDQLGVSDGWKGIFWSIGVASEILMMSAAGRVVKAIGVKRTISIGFLGMAVRLAIFSLGPPAWAVALNQTLHALTFTLFHIGMVEFIWRSFPTSAKASGQTVYNSVVWGLGGVVGAKVAGEISQALGLKRTFGVSALIALAALTLNLAAVREPERRLSDEMAGQMDMDQGRG